MTLMRNTNGCIKFFVLGTNDLLTKFAAPKLVVVALHIFEKSSCTRKKNNIFLSVWN